MDAICSDTGKKLLHNKKSMKKLIKKKHPSIPNGLKEARTDTATTKKITTSDKK